MAGADIRMLTGKYERGRVIQSSLVKFIKFIWQGSKVNTFAPLCQWEELNLFAFRNHYSWNVRNPTTCKLNVIPKHAKASIIEMFKHLHTFFNSMCSRFWRGRITGISELLWTSLNIYISRSGNKSVTHQAGMALVGNSHCAWEREE